MPRTWLRKQKQKLLRGLLWWSLMALHSAVRWIPLRAGVRLGKILGGVAYLLLVKERRRALHHLQLAFGNERSEFERRRIARESFRNLGRTLMEVLKLHRLTRHELDRLVYFEQEEALKEAFGRGRGVIFVTAHIGNWELLAAAVAARYPLAVVAAPIYDPRVQGLMLQIRAAHGIETLVRDMAGTLKRLMNFLRNGRVIGFLIDQDTRVDGVFVPFFHAEAYTPVGPARLALRTDAAVVEGFILRDGRDRHRIVIHGPLTVNRTADADQDAKDLTARFTRMIEDQIRKTPEQWVWTHRRWRTPGAEKPSA